MVISLSDIRRYIAGLRWTTAGRTPRLLTYPWQCSYLWKEPSHPHPPGMPRRQRIFGVCARARRIANKVCAPHSYPPASRGREWNWIIPLSPRAGTHAGTEQRTADVAPECVPARVPAGVSGTFKFLFLRVRGRTRVRSREQPVLHRRVYPPAGRGRERNGFSVIPPSEPRSSRVPRPWAHP